MCYRDLAGLVALPGQECVLPRPCGSCRLTWTGVCVTETLRVLWPYLDRRVCCTRCCSSRSQGTGCRRAARPGCRRRGSGNDCHLHRSDCTCPTLPRSPTHRPLKHNGVLSLPSSPLQHSVWWTGRSIHSLFMFISVLIHLSHPFLFSTGAYSTAFHLSFLTSTHSSRTIVYKYNYVGLHGNPERIQDRDLPRPCGSCRLTWTGLCVA